MAILHALRSIRRRHLVVPAAIAAIVLTASVPAWADEAPGVDEPSSTVPPEPPEAESAPVADAPLTAAPPTQRPRDWHRDPQRAPEHQWYGWQTLLADGGALLAAVALGAQGGATVGAVSYVSVAPIIHLAHRRPGAAAGSVGLRLALPVTGAFIGLMSAQGCTGSDYCALGGFVLGAAVGIVAASVIDAAALSYESQPPEGGKAARSAVSPATKPPKPTPKPIAFTPIAGPRREGGFDVGLAAVF